MARRRLPAFVFEYLDGGAEDEITLARNRSAFGEYAFVPRALAGCGRAESGTRIFDLPAGMPVMVAPMGSLGLFARDGDACLARASVAAGVPFIQSTVSNASIEDIASIPGIRHWIQLYVFRSPAIHRTAGGQGSCRRLRSAGFYGRRIGLRQPRMGPAQFPQAYVPNRCRHSSTCSCTQGGCGTSSCAGLPELGNLARIPAAGPARRCRRSGVVAA